MLDILNVEENIFVLDEDGTNLLLKDCVKFKINREERILVFNALMVVARTLRERGDLRPFIDAGILKKLTRQVQAVFLPLWEIRDEGRGTRLIFLLEPPDVVILSAVSKRHGSLSRAVSRGANRWLKYSRQNGK